jgi:hypothetical protein
LGEMTNAVTVHQKSIQRIQRIQHPAIMPRHVLWKWQSSSGFDELRGIAD